MSRKLTLFEKKKISLALHKKCRSNEVAQEHIGKEIQRYIEQERAAHGDIGTHGTNAKTVRMDQAFISRVLAGKISTLNLRVKLICKYVDIFDIIEEETPQSWPPSADLIESLGYAWDGSRYQEKMLCRLLRAVNGMGSANKHTAGNKGKAADGSPHE